MSLRHQQGLTLLELLVTVTISLLIFGGLSGVVRMTLNTRSDLETRTELMRQASFAMDRMVRSVSHSRNLILPLADRASTNWPEHIREQTIPASPPIGDSTLATAVLAVTLPAYSDLDFDGFPDADNDRDGRIDEDPGGDQNHDIAAGIFAIDDDGDGAVDESGGFYFDDDEYEGFIDEDPLNGLDDDGDGSVDEDTPADLNGDGCAGMCSVDDNANGLIDEAAASDDDEDGSVDEDWYDAVVFSLTGDSLIERTPVPWDESGNGSITGRDYVASEIANQVTRLRFERLSGSNGSTLLDVTLELTGADDQQVTLNRQVRLGGAL
jgi:prepilin-type N-terminal cleavage/methylation domain-containing protein